VSPGLEIRRIPMTAVTKEAFVLVLFALLFYRAAQEVPMLITPFVFR